MHALLSPLAAATTALLLYRPSLVDANAGQQLDAAAAAAAEEDSCPFLWHTLPGLELASPCVFPPCVEDSDGCVCMLHQVDYCNQPVAANADPFCASMVSWDPAVLVRRPLTTRGSSQTNLRISIWTALSRIVVVVLKRLAPAIILSPTQASIEHCRSEAAALQTFWGCPYLEQTVNIVPPLIHDTPCRHEACIADSDGCDCLHYQNIYCSQPQAASQDGSCTRALFLSALSACPPRPAATHGDGAGQTAVCAGGAAVAAAELELKNVQAELQRVSSELAALKELHAPPPPAVTLGIARTVFDEIVAKRAPVNPFFAVGVINSVICAGFVVARASMHDLEVDNSLCLCLCRHLSVVVLRAFRRTSSMKMSIA